MALVFLFSFIFFEGGADRENESVKCDRVKNRLRSLFLNPSQANEEAP